MRPADSSTRAYGPPISTLARNAGNTVANIEIDIYAGIKPKTGRITWDLGVIYYAYPNAFDPAGELNYVEFKVGGSAEILEGRHARRDGVLLAGLHGRIWPRVDDRDGLLAGLADDWHVYADVQRLVRLSGR